MVDGETSECVKSFCYLGDTLDGDGEADLVASTKRIQPARGWCATEGGTLCRLYPPTASPEARLPSFFGKPAVRSRSMAGRAPTPCGRH